MPAPATPSIGSSQRANTNGRRTARGAPGSNPRLSRDSARSRARRSAVADDLVPPLAYQGIEESARCLSGWHLHTTDADLDSDRIIRLHLDASLQPIYLIGACVVGFSEEADLWP